MGVQHVPACHDLNTGSVDLKSSALASELSCYPIPHIHAYSDTIQKFHKQKHALVLCTRNHIGNCCLSLTHTGEGWIRHFFQYRWILIRWLYFSGCHLQTGFTVLAFQKQSKHAEGYQNQTTDLPLWPNHIWLDDLAYCKGLYFQSFS